MRTPEQNFTGQRIGSLTVLGKTPWYSASGVAVWRCVCACCGVETYKDSTELQLLSISTGVPRKRSQKQGNRTRVTVSFPAQCPAQCEEAEFVC